ncbi:hypothetical protein T08_11179, partial [Trichinella sp. T8]
LGLFLLGPTFFLLVFAHAILLDRQKNLCRIGFPCLIAH